MSEVKEYYVVGMLHKWDSLEADSPWGRLLIGKAFGSTGFLPVFETREMADQHNTVGAPVFTIQEIVKVKS